MMAIIPQLPHAGQATQPMEMYHAFGLHFSVSCGLSQHFQPLIGLPILAAHSCLSNGGHHSLWILAHLVRAVLVLLLQ